MIVTTRARDIIYKKTDGEDSNDNTKRYMINLSFDDSIIFDHKTAEKSFNSDDYSIDFSK